MISASLSYRQRVGIAQALLGKPEVIILDEPTVGLDPIQIIKIRALIKELGQSHTVIFSSHILSEVQTLCDQILIISKGKLVAFDRSENLEKSLRSSNEITLTAEAAPQALQSLLAGVEHISLLSSQPLDNGLCTLKLKVDCDDIYQVSRALFFAFANQGTPLLELSLKKASLEDVFLELTEGDSQQVQAASQPSATEKKEEEKP